MTHKQKYMSWQKKDIKVQNGQTVMAQCPVILSASRATDIPAFYSEWLVNRIKQGYVKWKNPFNGLTSYISFEKARAIIFWSKNPEPLMKHLSFFNDNLPNYYFQYTLNDYSKENLEPNVPELQKRIETFIQLSENIGKEKVIWRFDPLILTDSIGVNELLIRVEKIADQLKNYTRKLVFSFADIENYRKVKNNLNRNGIQHKEFDEKSMNDFSSALKQLNQSWGLELATCAEKIPLEFYGISHNKCIDDNLLIELFSHDKALMDFLKVKITFGDVFDNTIKIEKLKDNKDKGQRYSCGCIVSKDIGEYNTCPHSCTYCYANTNEQIAFDNWKSYDKKNDSETIRSK